MNQVATINAIQLMITKIKALFAEIIPAGISLMAVRGFLESKFLSSQRLKAIAALRAKIMQRMTSKSLINKPLRKSPVIECEYDPGCDGNRSYTPKQNPINAKGIAKIVCENFTRLKYFLTINFPPPPCRGFILFKNLYRLDRFWQSGTRFL
jgi:hypothetical protein